jgi:predicted amidohydrolase
MAATAATHQVWVIACNAVGTHARSGAKFWGGSGIWAPSGLCLVQASRIHEELLMVHNVDILSHREYERDEFDYSVDFNAIYRKVEGQRTFTRMDM